MRIILATLIISSIGAILVKLSEYAFGVVNVFIFCFSVTFICGVGLMISQLINHVKLKKQKHGLTIKQWKNKLKTMTYDEVLDKYYTNLNK